MCFAHTYTHMDYTTRKLVFHTHVHIRLLLVEMFVRYLQCTKLSYMGRVLPLFMLVHDPLDCCHLAQYKPYTILL
jgi:hypothetical protein